MTGPQKKKNPKQRNPLIAPVPDPNDPNDPNTEGNLDKIRTILFGNQTREYDRRFTDLESSTKREIEQMVQTMENRLTTIERFFKQDSKTLSDRMKKDHAQRLEESEHFQESLEKLQEDFKGFKRHVDKRLNDIDEAVENGRHELRDLVLQQINDLSELLKNNQNHLREEIMAFIDELKAHKTDRAALAGLFQEMALRLNNELDFSQLQDMG